MGFAIERRANLSYEEFATQYLYQTKPVIVTDALSEWKALKRWTPEFFKAEFSEMKFTINDAIYGQAGYKANAGTEFTMAGFIDRVLASSEEKPAPYFRNQILHKLFPSLMADIRPLPDYLEPNWLGESYLVNQVGRILNDGSSIELYIGGTGGAFPVLHYDGAGTHAFLMQIYGTKKYIVYPPEQEPYLYPNPDKPNLSQVNSIDKPDLQRFPLFAKAESTEFNLEPGELLFVPAHWWHTAKMLTPSITVSANVLNESNWHELMSYVGRKRQHPLVSMAGKGYLTAAGAWRAVRDRRWRPKGLAVDRRQKASK